MFAQRFVFSVFAANAFFFSSILSASQVLNFQGDTAEVIFSQVVTLSPGIDFSNAREMPLPMLNELPETTSGLPQIGGVSSQEHGDFNESSNPWQKPYNTKRVSVNSVGVPATLQPYSAAGKLFFNVNNSTYVCSAALVKTGIVITAAHCVANFGQSQFYTDFVFVPGKHFGIEPHGRWNVSGVVVKDVYFNGTDSCWVYGVACRNDVAVLRLEPKIDEFGQIYYAGDSNRAGRFGFAVNDNGFNKFKEANITQLGYPVSHDSGLAMHENSSQSSQIAEIVDNNVIGSRMTGGSSGGPWLVNHGYKGKLNVPTGSPSGRNLIVGVTSWGYSSKSVKIQGASKLTESNGQGLINYYGCGTGSIARHCVD